MWGMFAKFSKNHCHQSEFNVEDEQKLGVALPIFSENPKYHFRFLAFLLHG